MEKFVAENLARHKLFTLGTSDSEGNPWVVCLNLSYDNNLNIIWKSDKNTVHSKNLTKNPNVSVCIFSDEPGIGDFGFYSKAVAHEVVDEKELADCLDARFRQKGKDVPPTTEFLGDSDYRIYVAEIKEAWVTDQSHTKNKLDLAILKNLLK
jgi:general stress protein 26